MPDTLLLSRADVATVLSMEDCITAVEEAFRMHGEGKTAAPGILGVHCEEGGFHIKAGVLDLSRKYFAAKLNGNFFRNAERGMPNIQGVIVLADAVNGFPMAVMDSIEITIQRTGAASAVAAKYLARPDSKTITICGCGNQGSSQLRALRCVLPLNKVFAFDVDRSRAEVFADEVMQKLKMKAEVVTNVQDAVRQSDVCVTCSPAKKWYIGVNEVRPGTFVAAVGADNDEKQEIAPQLIAKSKIVTDITDQCTSIGDLHHAIAAGVCTRAHVHGELGELAARKKPGRTSPDEITIFDSTGMALQDVAAAAVVYERAVTQKKGIQFSFFG